jgi:hypothetical protein
MFDDQMKDELIDFILEKDVGVSKEIGVHLEKRARLENERGQCDLGEVHADAHLRE